MGMQLFMVQQPLKKCFSSSKTTPVLNQKPIQKMDYIYKDDKN